MRMEHSENFKAVLEEKTRETESIIVAYLPKEEGFAKELAKAMNYSMTAGGKRLRPMLMQETYHLFGGTERAVEPFMAAMEMIHTHSLIHDDLPAIDNDDYRRGRKTTHVVFGEAVGVLAGDALLNYAYETAWKAFPLEEHTDRVVRAFGILCQKTGISGMLGGQSVDVMNEKAGHFAIDREMLDYIYENKTSALLEAVRHLQEQTTMILTRSAGLPPKSESRSRSGTTSWMSHPRWRSLESRFSAMKRMKKQRM